MVKKPLRPYFWGGVGWGVGGPAIRKHRVFLVLRAPRHRIRALAVWSMWRQVRVFRMGWVG